MTAWCLNPFESSLAFSFSYSSCCELVFDAFSFSCSRAAMTSAELVLVRS